jgi:GT2 family glycosyltransferase
MTASPLITVAFPLFRSAPFVENVAANIDRLGWPNLEVLISDRHGLDDALVRLEQRYAADSRVTIIRRTDGADWVTHYNDLIRTARGEYFCWMPHDDMYADGYIESLARALTGTPDALIAFGAMRSEDCGRPPAVTHVAPPPIAHDAPWSPLEVVHLHMTWELTCLVRGLVRRERVLTAGLLLPRTHQLVFADVCWAFAIALSGRAVFVPASICSKRYYASGASALWRFGVRQALSEWWTMSRALWRCPHGRLSVLPAFAGITYVAAARIIWRTVRRAIGLAGRRASSRARSAVLFPIRAARRISGADM